MRPVFGIFCLLGATSAGVLNNEDNLGEILSEVPGNYSCDIPGISTERVLLYRDFFEKKVDENGDGDFSVKELKRLYFWSDYKINKIIDHDNNQDTFWQKWCDEAKNDWEEVNQEKKFVKDRILDDQQFRLGYESFLNTLVSIKKDEFIEWIARVWKAEEQDGEGSLIGEMIFLFLDDDMSGELTGEENYLTFRAFSTFYIEISPFSFSKTANPKWPAIINKNFTLASCDEFKNDTQRAVLIQEFSDKVDKNNDGFLSAKELTVLEKSYKYSHCYDNYRNTGWEYCKLDRHIMWKYDQDGNHEISGQEMCGFWKAVVEDADEGLEKIRQRSQAIDKDISKVAYDEFTKNHPELVSMTKEKFINWIKDDGKTDLNAEFLFLYVDLDMSGAVDSDEENYIVFSLQRDYEPYYNEMKES